MKLRTLWLGFSDIRHVFAFGKQILPQNFAKKECIEICCGREIERDPKVSDFKEQFECEIHQNKGKCVHDGDNENYRAINHGKNKRISHCCDTSIVELAEQREDQTFDHSHERQQGNEDNQAIVKGVTQGIHQPNVKKYKCIAHQHHCPQKGCLFEIVSEGQKISLNDSGFAVCPKPETDRV